MKKNDKYLIQKIMTTKQILLNKCKITFIISKIDII